MRLALIRLSFDLHSPCLRRGSPWLSRSILMVTFFWHAQSNHAGAFLHPDKDYTVSVVPIRRSETLATITSAEGDLFLHDNSIQEHVRGEILTQGWR